MILLPSWARPGTLALTAAAAITAMALAPRPAPAQSGEPIRIGYGMALTGPLAANGKSALLAHKIWEEDINKKGGLLGRPVKLVSYDDQSNPSTVPGIYTKLLDIDKVDLVVGGYATNQVAPAMPVVIQKKKMFIALLALDANAEFKYPDYFSMTPTGPNPKGASIKGFFDIAMQQTPKPQTVAIVAADAEFSRNAADGARQNAKANNLRVVYDRTYPPATTDFAPIVRAIQASNPDILAICSYPLDSVGMVRAINEIGFTPKMVGGSMVGLQATPFKLQLGPLLNGIVNYDFWLPVPKMMYEGTAELFKTYQARAAAEGVDPLGFYMVPWAYAQMQVLAQAVEGTKSLNDQKLGEYIRTHTFKTVGGDIKFGRNGEWAQARVLQVQFHDVKGNDLAQFKDMSVQTVVDPPEYASGKLIYPYAAAKAASH
jgi:branched-chain amino acid transport system substrate-binding protein